MRIMIVEDEYFTATGSQSLLTKMGPGIEVLTILRSVSECVRWFDSHPGPDLAFMDIHLTDGPVFSLLEQVEVTCPVIFTTAYEEYMLKAFEADSIDYLLKPIKETDLQRALEKMKRFSHTEQRVDNQALMARMMRVPNESQMSYKNHFLIPWRDRLTPIPMDKTVYIRMGSEALVVMTTDRKKHSADPSLEKVAQELNPKFFFRANRQYIVAHNVIQSVSAWFGGKLTVALDIETPEKIVVSKAENEESKERYQEAHDPNTE